MKAKDSGGNTCLHLVFDHPFPSGRCWCDDAHKVWRYQCRTKDIVILMITAGADVCAVDGKGKSVSDVAIRSRQQTLWTEALKYCGIDIRDVLAQSEHDPAHSTALSPEYGQPPRSVTSKLSLEEYMERRKASRIPEEREVQSPITEFDSSEDDESEDDDSKSRESSFEDDENEDDDWTEDASEDSEVDEQESDDENHGTPLQYEGDNTMEKAKLD